MIKAQSFIEAAHKLGFGLYTGVPCSYLKPFINYVIDADDLRYVGAANEGDAVAIGAGAQLGGQRSVVMFQNSGLGNAVSPLTSLTYTFQLPVLLIPTLRGEPGGAPDEPQHELMGHITTELLELMRIGWEYFPDQEQNVKIALERAVRYMDETQRPYAFVMRKGSVDSEALKSKPAVLPVIGPVVTPQTATASRRDMLEMVQRSVGTNDIVLATTGYTGRELYALDDRDNQLYMVGSMGCATTLGLGLALAQPQRQVVVVDGDGAALMRMGAMATLGFERPKNLTHVLLDNGLHESTGGQSTVSASVDFCSIARGCGYPVIASVSTPAELQQSLAAAHNELSFIHVPTLPGVPEGLPRPEVTPKEVAQRLQAFIAGGFEK
ncbi:MAG: phosphonopyruvate decarboxylase [Gammaproteobacteria bacterium]|nr:phosphonopyruvate decarboxylase [Gammaproteobacteria bacterium]